MTTRTDLLREAVLSQDGYRKAIRAEVYALWNGTKDVPGFTSGFRLAVETGLTAAWTKGAERAGIKSDEFTDLEELTLLVETADRLQYVDGFATWIDERKKSDGGLFRTVWNRATLWVNDYLAFENMGFTFAKRDGKQVWKLGPTEKHCPSCSKYAGKVKRASQWAAADISPQSRRLKCRGYKCLCRFDDTDEPLSRGRLPEP